MRCWSWCMANEYFVIGRRSSRPTKAENNGKVVFKSVRGLCVRARQRYEDATQSCNGKSFFLFLLWQCRRTTLLIIDKNLCRRPSYRYNNNVRTIFTFCHCSRRYAEKFVMHHCVRVHAFATTGLERKN